MHVTGSTVAGDISVTFANPSVYETQGRSEYLTRSLAASESRIDARRVGAGLDEAQVARIRHLAPRIPIELSSLESGGITVLYGPLGAGKSDIAEGWLRSAISIAKENQHAPVPLWVPVDDLESSLELYVQQEVGLHALESLGADVVVDGLDERSDRAERVIRQADSLTSRWPKSRVVLTSRATFGVSTSTLVEVQPLSNAQGKALVSLVAGVARIGDMSPEIEESVTRPLFAILVGQQATTQEPTTMTEVIEGVVRRVVDSEDKELYEHLRQLAVETVTAGRPIDPESFADFRVASQLRASPFLTATTNGVAFSLATLEQWFAARAVLEGAVDIGEVLLADLVTFDRWKYVLSMILASGEPGRVDPIMAAVARWNPGAIAWIINETESAGLARSQRELSGDDWLETGNRVRYAVHALLDGLGPLAAAFTPFRVAGIARFDDLSLSVEAEGANVRTTWLISNQFPDHPLPPVVHATAIGEPPGRAIYMKQASAPLSRNWVWAAARNIIRSDLNQCFTTLVIAIASMQDGVVRRELEDMRQRDVSDPLDLTDIGSGLYGSIYPLPDALPDRVGLWPEFSVEAMVSRIEAVLQATIVCYNELCDSVATNFGDTLAHRGLMPFEYYGNVSYSGSSDRGPYELGPSSAWIQWLLRPTGIALPNGERAGENTVNITVNDDSRRIRIDDNYEVFGDAHFAYVANTPGVEPFADSFSVSSGRFDLIDKMPATHLALGWLWQDLMNLKWVSGLLPPDRTR